MYFQFAAGSFFTQQKNKNIFYTIKIFINLALYFIKYLPNIIHLQKSEIINLKNNLIWNLIILW